MSEEAVCISPLKKAVEIFRQFLYTRPSLVFPLDVLFGGLGMVRGPAAIGAAGENGNEELREMRGMLCRHTWALFQQEVHLLWQPLEAISTRVTAQFLKAGVAVLTPLPLVGGY